MVSLTLICNCIHDLQIMGEKSLIKKYQSEIRQLKEELEQLKRGILTGTPLKDATEDNIIIWKQKVIFFLLIASFNA